MPLHGEQSRVRTQVIRLLKERFDEVDAQRVKLLEDNADKDDDGKPIISEGVYKISEEGTDKFNVVYKPLLEESFELVLTGPQRVTLKNILLEMKVALTATDGETYDDILTFLESK